MLSRIFFMGIFLTVTTLSAPPEYISKSFLFKSRTTPVGKTTLLQLLQGEYSQLLAGGASFVKPNSSKLKNIHY